MQFAPIGAFKAAPELNEVRAPRRFRTPRVAIDPPTGAVFRDDIGGRRPLLELTPTLIEGWSGLPKLAVTSAPWANLVACAISLPALMAYHRWRWPRCPKW